MKIICDASMLFQHLEDLYQLINYFHHMHLLAIKLFLITRDAFATVAHILFTMVDFYEKYKFCLLLPKAMIIFFHKIPIENDGNKYKRNT